jgi:hypothetical protein
VLYVHGVFIDGVIHGLTYSGIVVVGQKLSCVVRSSRSLQCYLKRHEPTFPVKLLLLILSLSDQVLPWSLKVFPVKTLIVLSEFPRTFLILRSLVTLHLSLTLSVSEFLLSNCIGFLNLSDLSVLLFVGLVSVVRIGFR